MELSSITHKMTEEWQYRINEDSYIIKLRIKKNDATRVRVGYCDKYFKEKKLFLMPQDPIYIEARLVSSNQYFDYYEAILPAKLLLTGINDKISKLGDDLPPYLKRMVTSAKRLEDTYIKMLAIKYFFIIEGETTIYYGNNKFLAHEPNDVMDMFNLVTYQLDLNHLETPAWTKGAVIYQIFPERFYPTNGVYSQNWFTTPMKNSIRTNGTLRGIIEKIDYLSDLGVDAIYLNPIFLANSSHRYDTIDYLKIDPTLGSDDDFKELVEKLHEKNIKIILDLVFNHSSVEFFAFKDLMLNQESSKYKDWFFINKFPVEHNYLSDYPGFSYSSHMPKLNTSNKECREYLLNVTRKYLTEYDIDGYRLDVADEVSHDFWKEFRSVCKSLKPHMTIIGEIWYDSEPYLRGDEFDSIINYQYFEIIRETLKKKYSIQECIDKLSTIRAEYNLTYLHSTNLIVSSHDTNRIYTELKSKELYNIAMALLLTLPGSPIIYYGDEIMMEGENDPDCRRSMLFDVNKDTYNMIKRLVSIKHIDAFKFGDVAYDGNNNYITYIRYHKNDSYRVIINIDNTLLETPFKGENILNNTYFNKTLHPYEIVIIKD